MSFVVPQKPITCTAGPQSHPAWHAALRTNAWFFAHMTFDIGKARPFASRRLSASFSGLLNLPSIVFFPSFRNGFTSNV